MGFEAIAKMVANTVRIVCATVIFMTRLLSRNISRSSTGASKTSSIASTSAPKTTVRSAALNRRIKQSFTVKNLKRLFVYKIQHTFPSEN